MEQKIYIMAPANFASGGPLLLHQLAFKLRAKGFNAMMVYYNISNKPSPVHEYYQDFDIPYTKKIEDLNTNSLIVPETSISFLNKYIYIKKFIWWLSVDNFFITNPKKRRFSIKSILGLKQKNTPYEFDQESDHQHWVQSYYASEFLNSKLVKTSYPLSDYLDSVFIKDSLNSNNINNKKNIVAYNPKKGNEITKKLIEKAPNICWSPIENMSPNEVKNLLSESKVYIDFGNHPGKDRIPREAAICGCVILTNKAGSAAYQQDVFISDEFKFDYKSGDEDLIINKINEIFTDFEKNNKKIQPYRDIIIGEELRFENDLQKIIDIFFDKR